MKELELEAEKYARRFEENDQNGYNGESISIEDRVEMEAFMAGATSKWVEKQKLEFAIEQLKRFRECTFGKGRNIIKEIEIKLSDYNAIYKCISSNI